MYHASFKSRGFHHLSMPKRLEALAKSERAQSDTRLRTTQADWQAAIHRPTRQLREVLDALGYEAHKRYPDWPG